MAKKTKKNTGTEPSHQEMMENSTAGTEAVKPAPPALTLGQLLTQLETANGQLVQAQADLDRVKRLIKGHPAAGQLKLMFASALPTPSPTSSNGTRTMPGTVPAGSKGRRKLDGDATSAEVVAWYKEQGGAVAIGDCNAALGKRSATGAKLAVADGKLKQVGDTDRTKTKYRAL